MEQSLARRLLKELAADEYAADRIAAEINPIYTWVTYRTKALLGDQTAAPALTLMFAADDGTSTVIPTPETASLLELLAARGPMTISSCACLAEVETSELIEVLGSPTKLGLVALS